ncbi:DMT family transporter [Polaromonas sp. YR568]|uniref:DMT family transporter n=1 Tax=Polaromonas sp. YR568 TaxID=1855301 RepID=UPI003137A325
MSEHVSQREGAVLSVVTALMFSGSDALIKQLVAVTPFALLLWLRYAFQAILLAAWLIGTRNLKTLRIGRWRAQAARCALLTGSSVTGYLALGKVPLAEYTALMMLSPVLAVLLGRLFMTEQVTPLQWVLVGVGLAGMLVVARPGFSDWSVYTLLPILSACLYAAFQMISRRVMMDADVVTSNFLSAVFIVLTLGVVLWMMPGGGLDASKHRDLIWWSQLALMCLVATVGQISLANALKKASLAIVAPFAYLQIVFAALIGRIFFDQWPDAITSFGILLIALSGIGSVWWIGRRTGNQPSSV